MNNKTWNVTVLTDSGYIKTVRVDNCITREDAEAQALGMSGARSVFSSTPVPIFQEKYESSSNESIQTVVNNNYYYDDDCEDFDEHKSLDKLEEEMYNLMCEIALEEDREPPTYEEFYDYLNKKESNFLLGFLGKIKRWINK